MNGITISEIEYKELVTARAKLELVSAIVHDESFYDSDVRKITKSIVNIPVLNCPINEPNKVFDF